MSDGLPYHCTCQSRTYTPTPPPALVPAKVGLNNGDFYGLRCVEALGYDAADGVVRASMVHYNSEADVDRLITALDDAI